MTPLEAAKAVAVLQAAYPGARWSEATAQIYEQFLSDLEFESVWSAIARLVRTTKFLPTIAEIREATADLVLGPCRNAVDAWGDVVLALQWAHRINDYTVPKFKDAFVAECVQALGWRDLSNEPADRARFCDLYKGLQRKQRADDLSEPGRLLPAASGLVRVVSVRDLRDVGELPQREPPPQPSRDDPLVVRDPAELARLFAEIG